MSYFRVALLREAEKRRLMQIDLARGSGLSKSYVSRLLSGEGAELSDENFKAILGAFSTDKRAQAEIIAARCMDARVGPGSELVEIRIKDSVGKEESPKAPQVQLGQEAERAFAWLRSQCPMNSDLEKHIIGYARLTGMK
jgi:transcriptional regulator with XRE-family HTH domain